MPEEWSLCGLSVRPVSLWHSIALEQTGNAFMTGELSSMDDVASLMLFVTRDFADGRRLMTDQARRSDLIEALCKKLKRIEFGEIRQDVEHYIEDCMRGPDEWHSTPDPRPVGAPYQWILVATLCDHYGYSFESAWNESYAVARSAYSAHAEASGHAKVCTEREQWYIEHLDQFATEGTREVDLKDKSTWQPSQN